MNKDCEHTVKSFVNKMDTDVDYMLIRLSALHKIILAIHEFLVGLHINVNDFPLWNAGYLERLIKDLEHCGYSISNVDKTSFQVDWCAQREYSRWSTRRCNVDEVFEENKDGWNYEDSD